MILILVFGDCWLCGRITWPWQRATVRDAFGAHDRCAAIYEMGYRARGMR